MSFKAFVLFAKFSEKKERWQKIARDACKQSGNPWLPKLDDPVSLNDALSQTQGDDCWIGSLCDERIKLSPKPSNRTVSIFIGPEGGWTEEEEENALKAEFSFFTLGIHVLRMETAAISALAVARQHMLC